jgi:hypothetical protein
MLCSIFALPNTPAALAGHVPSLNCPAPPLCAPRAAPAPRPPLTRPRGALFALPCRVVIRPNCSPPLLTVVAALPAPPPASDSHHALLPGRPPLQFSPLSSPARATLPPPLPELRPRPPRSPPAARTSYRSLCPLFHLKRILELQCPSSRIPAPTFPRPFSFPTTVPHRTSTAVSAHRRQPPTPLPILDPLLLEHCRDPLVLPSPPNFALVHRNDRTTTPVSSSFRRRSASLSSHRSTAS